MDLKTSRRRRNPRGIESWAPMLIGACVAQYVRSAFNISANWRLVIR